MNIHKKLDRFAQWTKEKAGGNKATTEDDEFKALQQEMNQRHEGMQKLHTSATAYVKHLNRRTEGETKDKMTPVAYLGSTMSRHAQDFEPDSAFGQCLSNVGQANERIARTQDTYATSATSVWLESMDRSLAQMKEYQNSRKKLEQRRLAYDTVLLKAQRAKKDDYAVEEELRIQRAKYDEAAEDVSRRMQDIIDSENESINDLHNFLETQLNHFERCREILLQAKQSWPIQASESLAPVPSGRRSAPRSRQGTLSRQPPPTAIIEDDILRAPNAPFRAQSRATSGNSSPRYETTGDDYMASPERSQPISRVPTNESVLASRNNLKPVKRNDVFGDLHDETGSNSSGSTRADSPATSYGVASPVSRNTSYSTLDDRARTTKKAAPPPPPSRATKPKPPPPPPMKRNAASGGAILSTGF